MSVIVRAAHDEKHPYTPISNDAIGIGSPLSMKARGLLAFMLSLPDDWDFTVGGLAAFLPDGKRSIKSGLAELEAAGYVARYERVRDAKSGKLGGTTWMICEIASYPRSEPMSRNVTQDMSRDDASYPRSEPMSRFPTLDNGTLQSKDKQKGGSQSQHMGIGFRGEGGELCVSRDVQPESDSQLIPRGIQCIKCGSYIPQDGGFSVNGLPVCDACYTRDFVRRAI